MMTYEQAEEFECIGPNRWDIYYLASDHAEALEKQSEAYIERMLVQGAKFGHKALNERWDDCFDAIETNDWHLEAEDIKKRLKALNYE